MTIPRDVTAVIPHIPVRPHSLVRAVQSVVMQTQRVRSINVAVDVDREGSATTRNRALDAAMTTWVAFLDDDDYWYSDHLDVLLGAAELTGADVVYAGCTVLDAQARVIPRAEEWGRFGEDFSANILRQKSYIPVTSLVRTDLAQAARFGPPDGVDTPYDDWGFYLRLLAAGATFTHVPHVTWVWNHNGKNTSGQPDRW